MQLLSQVFSIKMLYRQLITITLSIYKNFSLGGKVLIEWMLIPRFLLYSTGCEISLSCKNAIPVFLRELHFCHRVDF